MEYVGIRDVWFGDRSVRVDVYENGSGKHFILESPSGTKEDVFYNRGRRRWEAYPKEDAGSAVNGWQPLRGT